MSVYRGEEHRFKEEYILPDDKELGPIARECRLDRTVSPRSHMEQEKRIRREIANSNERRRMQSINAGFQSLRTLLPSHEGEKLSKAAILQQTAEYIYQLEQEKTRLLSQNCQLKRLVNQHEGESNTTTTTIVAGSTGSNKKRKIDSITTSVSSIVCESSDEGIGSVSPEPQQTDNSDRREMIDLRVQLDRERRLRLLLEEQVRLLEAQMYPDRMREIVQLQYQHHDGGIQVIEHTGSQQPQQTVIEETVVEEMEVPLPLVTEEDVSEDAVGVGDVEQTVAAVNITELLTSTTSEDVLVEDVIKQQHETNTTHDDEEEEDDDDNSPTECRLMLRLPSVIEAAIKAEPKVEVERLPSPSSVADEVATTSTSRQNLETIVEAIRHLEGDHLFNDIPSPPPPTPTQQQPTAAGAAATTTANTTTVHRVIEEPVQEVPLALTTKQTPQRLIKVDMNPFLKFHTSQSLHTTGTSTTAAATALVSALQQQRPGVIVVKHT